MEANILPACGTGKSSVPAWHHDMGFDAWNKLQPRILETVLTKQKNLEEAEGMASASSKDASTSGVLTESVRKES